MERFLNDSPQTFEKTKTVEFLAIPGLVRHQIDIGLATAGTISVFPAASCGYKPVAMAVVDMATHDGPVAVEGLFKSFKLVPANISDDGYTVSYAGSGVS